MFFSGTNITFFMVIVDFQVDRIYKYLVNYPERVLKAPPEMIRSWRFLLVNGSIHW